MHKVGGTDHWSDYIGFLIGDKNKKKIHSIAQPKIVQPNGNMKRKVGRHTVFIAKNTDSLGVCAALGLPYHLASHAESVVTISSAGLPCVSPSPTQVTTKLSDAAQKTSSPAS